MSSLIVLDMNESNSNVVIPALAFDETLEYVRQIDDLEAELEHLYAGDPDDPRIRKVRAQVHHRLGICLKLAGVHSHLAVAEQVRGLREDLASGAPIPFVPIDPGERPLAVVRTIDEALCDAGAATDLRPGD